MHLSAIVRGNCQRANETITMITSELTLWFHFASSTVIPVDEDLLLRYFTSTCFRVHPATIMGSILIGHKTQGVLCSVPQLFVSKHDNCRRCGRLLNSICFKGLHGSCLMECSFSESTVFSSNCQMLWGGCSARRKLKECGRPHGNQGSQGIDGWLHLITLKPAPYSKTC